MRLEYSFELGQVDVPRFSVEAVEGIGKVFTLVTLVLNVLSVRERVDLVFHGLNPDDPARKLEAFRTIVESANAEFDLIFEEGRAGGVSGSSSYYLWVTVRRS